MSNFVDFRSGLKKVARGLWQYLREVSGEADYARYRTQALTKGEQPMTPHEFYRKQLQHKYSRPIRCC
jgi:uncharacterized short protein YbdD (DUF466 family)